MQIIILEDNNLYASTNDPQRAIEMLQTHIDTGKPAPVPLEDLPSNSIAHDALRVWMEFWDLTGRLRVDITKGFKPGLALRAIWADDDGPGIGRIEVIDEIKDNDIVRIDRKLYQVSSVTPIEFDDGFKVWKAYLFLIP